MAAAFVLGLLTLSTTLAWMLFVRRRERRPRRRAAGLALGEFAGLWTVSLIANLVLGVAIIFTVRTVTPLFVSIYVLNDVSLAVASGLQAFVLYWGRHTRVTRAA